jgi:hypothetical protein
MTSASYSEPRVFFLSVKHATEVSGLRAVTTFLLDDVTTALSASTVLNLKHNKV